MLPSESIQEMSEITGFRTREVRWFLNRPIPEAAHWFGPLPPGAHTRESREDVYLVLPDRNDIGVKFRENKLELKYRLKAHGPQEVLPGIRGSLESWEKLGFPSTPNSTASNLPEGSRATRVPVLKQRLASILEQTDAGAVFHSLGTPVLAGVQFEYTKLEVLGSDWYTLGLEWPEDNEVALPTALLSDLLAPCGLAADSSMGYPEFLQRVVRDQAIPGETWPWAPSVPC